MREILINQRWPLTVPDHRDRGEWWDVWEAERLASMYDNTKIGDLVYYVGAEEGDMPALISTWGCDTVLIEPGPRVWANIYQTYQANDCPHPLATFQGFAGATDRDVMRGLTVPGWPLASNGPIVDNHGFANLSERPDIPVITLDTMVGWAGAPDAISIDVEGAELAVLQGAAALVLSRYRPLVWVSIHPEFMGDMYDTEPEQIHDLMDAHDYVGELLADTHEQHWLFRPEETAS